MKVAETSSSRDSEPAETRGSWVKWTRHLARKSRVSSNENGPRRLIKFAGHVHNRTAPADGGRLREIVPIEIQGAHTSRPLFRPRRTRPFRRSPGGLPSVLRSFQISRENLVNATSVRDRPGSTTVHRTHGRSGTFGAIARVVIPHRPRTSLQTRVIRFASPSTHLRGFASLAG